MGWHGGGFTGARFSIDEGAATIVRGSRRAVMINVTCIMEQFCMAKIESRIEITYRETNV